MDNMIPVLGIPHFNRLDLLRRCIQSIDYPVDKLVIVDQGPVTATSPRSSLRSYDQTSWPSSPKAERETGDQPENIQHSTFNAQHPIKETIIIRHPNAGVAGAWNEIIKLFPGDSGHWWLIANDDIQFAPGDLQRMSAECGVWSAKCGILYGNHGASFFALTRYGVEKVGLFDENIYPAYLEDCDWSYRADLLGVRRMALPGCLAVHGGPRDAHAPSSAGEGWLSGSCTVNSDPVLREKNMRTHGANFNYYRAKWGGINGQEQYKTPFNDPHWPVWAWKFDPEFRQRQQW